MQPDPPLPEPWFRPAPQHAAALEHEARKEISPGHELAGHALTAIAACPGCDRAAFRLDDGSFAIINLTWTSQGEPPPWPATQHAGGYIALETLINDHQH
jgi:hypothetical protein